MTAPSNAFAIVPLVGPPRHALADTHTRLLNIHIGLDTTTYHSSGQSREGLAGGQLREGLAGGQLREGLAGGQLREGLAGGRLRKRLVLADSCMNVLSSGGRCRPRVSP